MNRARSLIGGGNLPRDLFAERHAGYKMRRVRLRMKGRGLPRPGRHKGRPSIGDPSAGDQSIARGIGGRRPRQAIRDQHVAELLGDRCFRSAVREGVWRKKNFADALAAAAFCEPAARQTMPAKQ